MLHVSDATCLAICIERLVIAIVRSKDLIECTTRCREILVGSFIRATATHNIFCPDSICESRIVHSGSAGAKEIAAIKLSKNTHHATGAGNILNVIAAVWGNLAQHGDFP